MIFTSLIVSGIALIVRYTFDHDHFRDVAQASSNRSLLCMENSVQRARGEERNRGSSGEGTDGSGDDGHDEILQQQVEVEEHVPSPPTLPCSPLSRPRAVLSASK